MMLGSGALTVVGHGTSGLPLVSHYMDMNPSGSVRYVAVPWRADKSSASPSDQQAQAWLGRVLPQLEDVRSLGIVARSLEPVVREQLAQHCDSALLSTTKWATRSDLEELKDHSVQSLAIVALDATHDLGVHRGELESSLEVVEISADAPAGLLNQEIGGPHRAATVEKMRVLARQIDDTPVDAVLIACGQLGHARRLVGRYLLPRARVIDSTPRLARSLCGDSPSGESNGMSDGGFGVVELVRPPELGPSRDAVRRYVQANVSERVIK